MQRILEMIATAFIEIMIIVLLMFGAIFLIKHYPTLFIILFIILVAYAIFKK